MIPFSSVAPALFVVFWSTGFIGARYAMPWAEPFIFLAARSFITFALLALLVAVLGSARLTRRQAAHSMLAGAMMHGLYLGGLFWAIHNGMPAGLAALVIGFQPLITALLAACFLGEDILARHWTGLGIGFAGVAAVVVPRLGDGSGEVSAATIAACLAAALAISAGTVWQKRFLAGAPLVSGAMWQYLGAGLLTAALSLAFEKGEVTLSGELVFAMIWLVLVLSVGAIFLLMRLIREGAMARVGSLFYLVPAVTALMAWLLFGESLTPVQLGGMALASLGVALATQPATRARASR